ncbi:MAG: PTS glucose transporter subunit IIA [Oscillospiraceae bacterium]|nr:PTS glucose transporter subunit IIA [Oscillospiraceae bacterium]
MIFNRRKHTPAYTPIFAPIRGEVIPIHQVSDPSFAGELLGKGIAIRPAEGRVAAPVSGTVVQMFETGHAVTLIAEDGAEILIHVGIDTVQLKGQHFKACIEQGAVVQVGDLLIEFDCEAISAAGYDTVTPMVILNSDEYEKVEALTAQKTVNIGDEVIRLFK